MNLIKDRILALEKLGLYFQNIKAENPARAVGETQRSQYEIEFVDFISGGTAVDGIVSVTKVRKE
jgi:DNA-dependent RNA polymerase auxiliary subunit epsilon